MKRLLFLSLLLISFNIAAKTNNRTGLWLGSSTKHELADNLFWKIDGQLRYEFDRGQMQQTFFQMGSFYKFNKTHSAGLFFAFLDLGGGVKEHRISLNHVQKYIKKSNYSLSGRIQLEGRFFEDINEDAMRLRYFIRSEIHQKWVIWNDIFINTEKKAVTGNSTIDRNRFFVGIKRKLKNGVIEYGYMNQYIPRDGEDISEHLLMTTLKF